MPPLAEYILKRVSMFVKTSGDDKKSMKYNEEKVGSGMAIFVLLIAPILTVAAIVANGWVLMNLWEWFVTPLGVHAISYLQAAGLIALIRFAMPEELGNSASDDDSEASPMVKLSATLFGLLVVRPGVTFLVGMAIHHFMV